MGMVLKILRFVGIKPFVSGIFCAVDCAGVLY